MSILPSRPNSRRWSDEQAAIFVEAKTPNGNVVVEALAGTGKTTTIIEMFSHCPESNILYAVFGKRNQKEAEEKIKDARVQVKTLHSLGYSFIRRAWAGVKPDDDVEWDRLNEVLMPFPAVGKDRQACGMIVKLVGFLKNLYVGMPTQEEAYRVAEERECLAGLPALDEKIVMAAMKVLEVSMTKRADGRISFDDMVWLPAALNMVRPIFNLVVIDEAQDMNMPQLWIARNACKTGGRVIVVGDSRQAIYGFRGAVQDGMNMMRLQLRAKVLTLSTTYRCPKAVVAIAAKLVPNYKAADINPQGEVLSVGDQHMMASAKPGDVILSRLNAPLMPKALNFLRRNIPARIEGRDIGQQLIGMVRKFKASSVKDLIEKIEAWRKATTEKLSGGRNPEKRIEQINDIAATLSAIAEESPTVEHVTVRLEMLFQDSNAKGARPAVVLSSVHKAKGLEWDKVYLLCDTFRRGKGQEEDNIYYVAVTRAKATLAMVEGGEGSEDKAPEAPVAPTVAQAPETAVIEAPKTPETAVQPAPKKEVAKAFYPTTSLTQGHVYLKVGDVLLQDGFEYVVDMVNDCRARLTCLEKSEKTITTRFGETATIKSSGKQVSIATTTEPQNILRHLTAEQVKNLLAGKKSVGATENKNNKTERTDDGMKKNTAKTGSADYMRKLVGEGKSKAECLEAFNKKYADAFKGDEVGITSRYNMAVKLAKSAAEKEKAAEKTAAAKEKAAAAKAKASKPVAKTTAKAKTSSKPTAKSTPPPRPAATPAPAAAAAPADVTGDVTVPTPAAA
jgi:hypothetical protein